MADAESGGPVPGRLPGLLWLRERLIRQIDADETCVCEKPKQSQLAPLAARLADVLEQIDVIEKAKPRGSKVDELAGKRKDRRSRAAGAGSPPGDSVDGGAGRG